MTTQPMYLYESLSLMLQTVSETFGQMEQLFGRDIALRILEEFQESVETTPIQEREHFPLALMLTHFKPSPPGTLAIDSPFDALENAVRAHPLGEALEFYVWSFPYYRYLAESSLALDDVFDPAQSPNPIESARNFTAAFEDIFDHWVQQLQITEQAKQSLKKNTRSPWLKLRTGMLKKLGIPLLGKV